MAITYKIDGMTCGGCARRITNAIKSAAPHAEVETDVARRSVQIRGLREEEAVKAAIREAGYEPLAG